MIQTVLQPVGEKALEATAKVGEALVLAAAGYMISKAPVIVEETADLLDRSGSWAWRQISDGWLGRQFS